MKILILGVAGTFMAGIATLAKQLGHDVEGVDQAVYPPMSDYLDSLGVVCYSGYDEIILTTQRYDLIIVGNAMSRGNPLVEAMLNQGCVYTSGPAWLSQQVLQHRRVLAVSGTHGKTSTSSMLAWILSVAGVEPGFLIGGIPENFAVPARLGKAPFFVIEADEYDTAFWDKRSKFMHYRPSVLLCHNLEFDHVDIFPDLAAIQKQFALLMRTVPATGKLIRPKQCDALDAVIAQGCWTPTTTLSTDVNIDSPADFQVVDYQAAGSQFQFTYQQHIYTVNWLLFGEHNVANGLAAIASAHAIGIDISEAIEALATFRAPKRRMEIRGTVNGITVIDDFAHHPTAIKTTLQALKDKFPKQRIHAVLEFASNTMRSGYHGEAVFQALSLADNVWLKQSDTIEIPNHLKPNSFGNASQIIDNLSQQAQSGDVIIIMSNSGFEGVHQKLLTALSVKYNEAVQV